MSERIDDRLLLLAQSDKMGVPELLNAHFKPHVTGRDAVLAVRTVVLNDTYDAFCEQQSLLVA
jgi:hypothetical protein